MKVSHAEHLDFVPLRDVHFELFARWISTDHVRPWWGDPAVELENVRAMVEGRDSTRPFCICLDGRPIGYIQVWYPDDWRDEETVAANPWVALLPAGCVGVDICIGEESLIGQGLGSTAVRLFSERLVSEGHDFIIIDPDPDNWRAVRAYRSAGYREVSGLVDPKGEVLLLKFDPQSRKEPK